MDSRHTGNVVFCGVKTSFMIYDLSLPKSTTACLLAGLLACFVLHRSQSRPSSRFSPPIVISFPSRTTSRLIRWADRPNRSWDGGLYTHPLRTS
ncbi:hypothetical protein BP00DRAFT_134238 [Aspergillus indologenus CBS 114.80]|uniref:Uncharacterized protein n=1 Tax=Aspergillus indologenus CBS 114.80 TaxID=1450541 RepID=A0A2V5I8I3_9EURO|nr:hypothetical protein BP00DRAFT_134238 [Aspergillus indologenus CBS 114.80]